MKKLLGIDIGGTKTAVIYAREEEGNRIEIVDKSQFRTTNVEQTINEIFSHLDEWIAVSYTHLDVYKRQHGADVIFYRNRRYCGDSVKGCCCNARW